jgi:hypothetical protein
MESKLSDALLPVLVSLAAMCVHVVFIQEDSGERWMASPEGEQNPLPHWLAKGPLKRQLSGPDERAVEILSKSEPPKTVTPPRSLTLPFGGTQRKYGEYVLDSGSKVAIVEWDNHMQMIEVGLLLRGTGCYSAVKVKYKPGKKGKDRELTPACRGVEWAVKDRLRQRFGVSLEWGVEVMPGGREQLDEETIEELLKELPADRLVKSLSPEKLRALSPEVRAALAQRLEDCSSPPKPDARGPESGKREE